MPFFREGSDTPYPTAVPSAAVPAIPFVHLLPEFAAFVAKAVVPFTEGKDLDIPSKGYVLPPIFITEFAAFGNILEAIGVYSTEGTRTPSATGPHAVADIAAKLCAN